MTTKVVTDDRQEPTAEQVVTFTKRLGELLSRFLKGVMNVDAVLDKLQEAIELTKGFINCNGRPEIPSWAHPEHPIIKHIPCGVIDPARLSAVDVFREGEEVLNGDEYMTRVQALDSMKAWALDFYAKPENWKYLPEDGDVIVFPKTEFRYSNGDRFVRSLYRDGAEWIRYYDLVGSRFGRGDRVAVLVSSPQ